MNTKKPIYLAVVMTGALMTSTVFAQPATPTPAGAQQTDRSFSYSDFMGNKMKSDAMISKEQYMKEMERRWIMADKMMGDKAGKGFVTSDYLMKAFKDSAATKGGM